MKIAIALALLCTLSVAAPPHRTRPVAVLHARLDGYMMAVQGTVRGKALWFDLDSGGIHSIIDSSTANTLQLTSARTLNVRGAGSGQVLATQLRPFDVRLARAHFRPSDPLSTCRARAA